MISAKKIATNQTNALASTGPKTARGKTRAAQNARRHGLSSTVRNDPSYSEEIESLAREIAGKDATNEVLALARRVAEAQVDLIRIRQVQHKILTCGFSDSKHGKNKVRHDDTKLAKRIGRQTGVLTPVPPELMPLSRSPLPEGVDKISDILSGISAKLMLMNRYEQRARSRRKFAIRALDALRRDAAA